MPWKGLAGPRHWAVLTPLIFPQPLGEEELQPSFCSYFVFALLLLRRSSWSKSGQCGVDEPASDANARARGPSRRGVLQKAEGLRAGHQPFYNLSVLPHATAVVVASCQSKSVPSAGVSSSLGSLWSSSCCRWMKLQNKLSSAAPLPPLVCECSKVGR